MAGKAGDAAMGAGAAVATAKLETRARAALDRRANRLSPSEVLMCILIAEDERITRATLVRHLEGWGYSVTATEDGAKAWEALQVPAVSTSS